MNQIKKMLAVPAAVFALWAMSATAATNDDIAKRLEPVGQVCVQGQECKGMEVVASAGGGGAKTPDEIIAKELSLAGVQRPLSEEELPGFTPVFRFGDFAGWLYEKAAA